MGKCEPQMLWHCVFVFCGCRLWGAFHVWGRWGFLGEIAVKNAHPCKPPIPPPPWPMGVAELTQISLRNIG